MRMIKKWLIKLGLIKCNIHDWRMDALATKFGKKQYMTVPFAVRLWKKI